MQRLVLYTGWFEIDPAEIPSEEFVKPLDLHAHKLALALRVPANRIQPLDTGA